MTDRLQILVCKTYQREVMKIIQDRHWEDVELIPVPQACIHPQLRLKAADDIRQASINHNVSTVLVGGCFVGTDRFPAGLDAQAVRCLDQCFYMIANRTMVDHSISQGGYILSPGWLEEWRFHLEQWGLDQQTAREFFNETTRKLVLLDTGLNLTSSVQLQDMGAYLEMPVEILPVGLDFLDLYLSQIVFEWRTKKAQRQTEAIISEANRNAADYAMTIDLLTNLTRSTSEVDAITEITDLFTMLFSSGSVIYRPIVDGKLSNSFNCSLKNEECKALEDWAVENKEAYLWVASGDGFYLRLSYQNQTVGVLRIANLQLPQYKQQYLNLSLSIARLCGLAIFNARTYQKLQQAERIARHEKEISETLRQVVTELTSQLDLGEVLNRILISLYRLIPYESAAIFMLDATHLIFQTGLRHTNSGEIIPYSLPVRLFEFELSRLGDTPVTIPNIQQFPRMQQHLGGSHIQGWLGVPLMLGGELIGYLSIGSQQENAYGKDEAALAQIFANQASIAIENARLFKEVQYLAVTDSLTGLYNRRHFYELAVAEFKRSSRYNRPLSVIMMDVDHFKRVNDTYGHAVGDQVLIKIAECCRQKVRGADVAGRYGGEEYVLLLPETNQSSAEALAERLRQEIAGLRISCNQDIIQVTISLGVACLESDYTDLEELLRRSDQALYEAKQTGRNRIYTWDSSLQTQG